MRVLGDQGDSVLSFLVACACRYSLVWVVQNYSFFVFHYLVSFIVMDLIVASFLV